MMIFIGRFFIVASLFLIAAVLFGNNHKNLPQAPSEAMELKTSKAVFELVPAVISSEDRYAPNHNWTN